MCIYDKLFSNERLQQSSFPRENPIEDFYSDRSRIIYSSSFRRLQQKAQVFSLETNSNVRTRLTHSIEVSDLGKTLANNIGYGLKKHKLINNGKVSELVAIVENACLVHDIGNPPFGHFGEAAIRRWGENVLNEDLFKKAQLFRHGETIIDNKINNLIKDFTEFDGNPQGFRVISKLHCERDQYSLNLTVSTLLCALKYVRSTNMIGHSGIDKKAGYFQTEAELVNLLWNKLGMEFNTRFPFTYIMEAADDVAYCLSDIADGIEKNVIHPNEFLKEIKDTWEAKYDNMECPMEISESVPKELFSLNVSVVWSRKLLEAAAQLFLNNIEEYMTGKAESLLSEKTPYGKFLSTIKQTSKKFLYSSEAAEKIELAGYSVILGLLEKFQCLLELPYVKFEKVLNNTSDEYPLELRIFHRIGSRYVKRYRIDVDALDQKGKHFAADEWWLRAHMIIDYISGMTDDFALSTYQILYGIQL